MKKAISCIAALVLAVSMSTTVFAASPITALNGTDSCEVNGTYSGGSSSTVYKMDVSWGSMDFTYNAASAGTWNPDTHAFTGTTTANWSWDDNTNKITVTNHSNAAINAKFSFSSSVSGIIGGFYNATKNGTVISGNKLPLATAVGTTVANAPKGEAFLQISSGSISADRQIGSVTVTLE